MMTLYDDNLRQLVDKGITGTLYINQDFLSHAVKVNEIVFKDLSKTNKVEEEIYTLKTQALNELTTLCMTLEQTYDIVKELDLRTSKEELMYTDFYCIVSSSSYGRYKLSAVLFVEDMFELYPFFYTPQRIKRTKRKLIKQVKQARKDINRTFKQLERFMTKLEKWKKKQERNTRIVLNCNTWLNSICETTVNRNIPESMIIEEPNTINDNTPQEEATPQNIIQKVP